jgi:hypothetical protein
MLEARGPNNSDRSAKRLGRIGEIPGANAGRGDPFDTLMAVASAILNPMPRILRASRYGFSDITLMASEP